ncbi:major capsid protein P2 [Grimontia hollisae]|uniref:major capsid protein P2 n=1 Tax=Grimontia hollisae TaxID=673 RepID=UPI0023DC7BD9|nr:major capsid protein P2 [Grimontia hollisae]MDF2185456.1 major capsid protein P2 [Grimontia hollisae]
MRLTHKLPSFSNVVAGATATLQLPLGLSFHMLLLEFAGVTLAQMKNIRLEVNGKVVQKWKDGERLNSMNKHYKRGTATASSLPIWFIRPEMDDPLQQRVFAIGTSDVQTLTLLIDIDSAATAPVLKAHAIKGNQSPIGIITKIKTFPVSFATAGEQEIDNLPLPRGARIAAIHLYSPDITRCELDMNGRNVFELDKTLTAKIQTDYQRDPQTSDKMSMDFMLEGDMSQALVLEGVQDFRIRPTLANPGAVDVVVEYLDQFNGGF